MEKIRLIAVHKVIASQEMFVTGDKWLNFQKQIINADK